MKTQTATAVVALLLLASAGMGGATTPSDSLATEFDSSTTAPGVVVTVGSPGTDNGTAAMMAANAIANKYNYTVVHVPGDVPASVIQALSERAQNGDLRNAIVVGVGQNRTDTVAAALTDVGDNGITVEDQITGETPSDLLYRSTLQTWDSSNTAYVTTLSGDDPAKISLAVTNETAPVLAQSMAYEDMDATLQTVGVSTVYVTPGITDSTRDQLRDDGYTVVAAPGGVTLDQSVQEIAVGYAGDTTEDVIVVGTDRHIHTASQVGSGANATVLVTDSSGRLGDTATAQIQNFTEVNNVYVLGNTEDVDASVFTSIADAARTNASVDRVTRVHGNTEMYLRTSTLVSGYQYGVLTSHVEQTGDTNITVDITNIGYSTVQAVDDVSVTAAWSGDGRISSTPDGETRDGDWVVTNDVAMDSGETFTVELEASKFDNGGHPELGYYVGSSGALVSSGTSVDFDALNLGAFPWWAKALLLVGIVFAGIGITTTVMDSIKTRSRRRARARRRFGLNILSPGLRELVIRVMIVLIALGLMLIPDPVPVIDEVLITGITVLIQLGANFDNE